MLEDFPRLTPLLGRRGGALSGGEQQILAIARCLVGNPRQDVMLDEPTEGIQPSIIEEIVDVLRQLHQSQGLDDPPRRAESRVHRSSWLSACS